MGGTVNQDQLNQLLFSVGAETWTVSRFVLVASDAAPAVVTNQSQSTLNNNGSIHSLATIGVLLDVGSTAAIVNNSATGTIRGLALGVKVEGANATINNKGGIVGTTDYGVALSFQATGAQVNNEGVIKGDSYGIFVYSTFDGGTITNAGQIYSDGASQGWGIGVNTVVGKTTVIVNQSKGTVKGGPDGGSILTQSNGQVSLTNAGLLDGKIDFNAPGGNDRIVNKGTVNSTAELGPGNDAFVFAGGKQGIVFGEAGADRFDFSKKLVTGKAAANVGDMTPGTDNIGLSKALFKDIGEIGPLKNKYFQIGTKAKDKSDHIIYDPDTGICRYDPDGKGGTKAKIFAILDGGPDITASDFVVLA